MTDTQVDLPHGGYNKLVAYRNGDMVYHGTDITPVLPLRPKIDII